MANRRQAGSKAAICLIFITMLIYGCTGGQIYPGAQTTQGEVIEEYMLTKAGFKSYKPNMDTPKTQALLDAMPSGQITTFRRGGQVYHAYPDKLSNTLYVGDQAAYENYVSMAQDKKVCQRVDAPDSSGFWGCFQEMQQKATK
jgi:hypothetical protein